MLALLLFAAQPAAAETPPAPTVESKPVAAPVATPVAEADIREYAAIVGRKAAGRPVTGPYRTADKVLAIARDDKGYPDVVASFALPVRQSLPAPPPQVLAMIRLHQTSQATVPGPTEDDFAFVAANKLPLFVIGEWARPAPMWEVAWLDGSVSFRRIGEVGEIGPWQD